MANFITNSNLAPEYLESNFKTIITPAVSFTATLTKYATSPSITSGTTIVNIIGDDSLVYGTFTLDTLNSPVTTVQLTNLAKRLKYTVVSGTGTFNITMKVGV